MVVTVQDYRTSLGVFFFFFRIVFFFGKNRHHLLQNVEKVGNYLKTDIAKPGYKSKHESTKRWGWLEWRSHRLPTSYYKNRNE